MAENRNLQIAIELKDKVSAQAKNVTSSLGSIEKSALSMGAAFLSFSTLTTQLSDAFAKASEFDSAMRQVNTLARLGEKEFEKLNQQILNISTTFPFTAKELANGMMDIVSSGVEAENQLAFLKQSAMFASAGATSMTTAVSGLVAVIKGWGLETAEATRVSDLFFRANDLGITSVAEIADSIQRVTNQAKLYGLSIEELFTVYATFTGVTGNAAEVTTQLSGALNALAAATPESAKLFKELGVEVGAAAIQKKGLAQVAKDVFDAVGGDVQQLRKLIPEINGARMVAALATGQFESFNEKLELIKASSGSTEAAFNEMSKSVEFSSKTAANNIDVAKISIASSFSGIRVYLSDFVSQLARTFNFLKTVFVEGLKISVNVMVGIVKSAMIIAQDFANKVIGVTNSLFEKLGLEKRFESIAIIKTTFSELGNEMKQNLAGAGQQVAESFKFMASSSSQLGVEFQKTSEKEQALSNLTKDLNNNLSTQSEAAKENADSVSKLKEKYEDFENAASSALESLRSDHQRNLSSIRQDIEKTVSAIADLNRSYENEKKTDTQRVAEQVVKAEENISDIKQKIAESTSQKQKDSLTKQLLAEQTALSQNAAFISSIASDVAEARRRAGLSELQRAIEDYNQRRALADTEYAEKMTRLEGELAAFKQKEMAELISFQVKEVAMKQLMDEGVKNYQAVADQHFNITKNQIEAEIKLYQRLADAMATVKKTEAAQLAGVADITQSSQSQGVGGVNITVNGDVSGRDLVKKVQDAIMNGVRMNTKITL